MNDYELLTLILERIQDVKKFNDSFITSSKEEFSCNDLYIKLGIGIVNQLVNITNKLDPIVILNSDYLIKELPLLNRYNQNLFNSDNSVNAYKLYDFLTHEIYDLEKGIIDIMSKFLQ